MLNIFQIIMLLISTPLTLLWLFFACCKGRKYKKIIASVPKEEYPLRDLFCVGFATMSLLHISTKSKKAKAKIKEIGELRGKRFAEYYYYVSLGEKFTYAYTIVVATLLLTVLGNSLLFLVAGMLLDILAVWYIDLALKDKLSARRDEILMDFPRVLSKLTLLLSSGMVMRDAWKQAAGTTDRVLYREMRVTTEQLENGALEVDAYKDFADRCGIKEVRKFSSSMIQNLQKGNKELGFFLKELADEMWDNKKHEVKRKGEEAGTKLLIPTLIIFMGILVLIMVPVFGSF